MVPALIANDPKSRAASSSAVVAGADRIASIDALRGFDMFWIVGGRELVVAAITLVVTLLPASIIDKDKVMSVVEYQATHVHWQGFTAWDLIMPLFLFVVGAAMPFSFSRRHGRGAVESGSCTRRSSAAP